jgi:hypothetical protein
MAIVRTRTLWVLLIGSWGVFTAPLYFNNFGIGFLI